MFGDESMFCTEVFWCGTVFGDESMFCTEVFLVRDGPPPRNRPGRSAVFRVTPPNPQKSKNRNGKRSANRKKNAYFSFKLLIINDINQYFNIHLYLIGFIIYNR